MSIISDIWLIHWGRQLLLQSIRRQTWTGVHSPRHQRRRYTLNHTTLRHITSHSPPKIMCTVKWKFSTLWILLFMLLFVNVFLVTCCLFMVPQRWFCSECFWTNYARKSRGRRRKRKRCWIVLLVDCQRLDGLELTGEQHFWWWVDDTVRVDDEGCCLIVLYRFVLYGAWSKAEVAGVEGERGRSVGKF